MNDAARTIHSFLASRRGEEERFLAELVKVPSDNPPGDCAPHARRAAELLEALGFVVERHVVPDDAVKANGMVSCTNLVVRVPFGTGKGPVIALNAHGDAVAPGEPVATVGSTGGSAETGLYFELRYLGKAFDPLRWSNLK